MNKFEDYQGIPIFEIPIYAYSKDDYRERWEKKEKRDREALIKKDIPLNWRKKWYNEKQSILAYGNIIEWLVCFY